MTFEPDEAFQLDQSEDLAAIGNKRTKLQVRTTFRPTSQPLLSPYDAMSKPTAMQPWQNVRWVVGPAAYGQLQFAITETLFRDICDLIPIKRFDALPSISQAGNPSASLGTWANDLA